MLVNTQAQAQAQAQAQTHLPEYAYLVAMRCDAISPSPSGK